MFSERNPEEFQNLFLQIENDVEVTKRNILDLVLFHAEGYVLKSLKKCNP